MKRYFAKQQLSEAILKTFLILFGIWHIRISNCMKVTLNDKQTNLKNTNIQGMKPPIRVERGIYFPMDKQDKSNDSSETYYLHNWFFVQTINDTMTNFDTLSSEKNATIVNLIENKSTILTSMKNKDLNNPKEKHVFEEGRIRNLCDLCDCKTGDNVPCNINRNKNNNSNEGM